MNADSKRYHSLLDRLEQKEALDLKKSRIGSQNLGGSDDGHMLREYHKIIGSLTEDDKKVTNPPSLRRR